MLGGAGVSGKGKKMVVGRGVVVQPLRLGPAIGPLSRQRRLPLLFKERTEALGCQLCAACRRTRSNRQCSLMVCPAFVWNAYTAIFYHQLRIGVRLFLKRLACLKRLPGVRHAHVWRDGSCAACGKGRSNRQCTSMLCPVFVWNGYTAISDHQGHIGVRLFIGRVAYSKKVIWNDTCSRVEKWL